MSKNPKIDTNGNYEGVVYMYFNTITKKSYIGLTDNEENRRKRWKIKNTNSYGGKKITEARKMYGVDDSVWTYSVLEKITDPNHDELNKKLRKAETKWIRELDTVNDGYNSSYGSGMQGLTHNKESREKISKHHRKTQSEATKKKISESLKGRKVSEKTKAKISKSNSGKKRSEEQRKAQSQRMKGINPIKASEAAAKWREEHGSYWKGKTMSEEAKANMKRAQQEKGTSCVATFPDGHEEEFPTMLDAAKATGVNVGSVASAIKTGGKTNNNCKYRRK